MINEQRDIAIVGISVFCPAGESVDEVWDGIARGGDFITDAPPDVIEPYHFSGQPNGVDRFYCKRGGFCKRFRVDLLRYGILPIAADGADPDQLVSLAGVEQALIDADVFEKNISLNKCSIIIGKGNFSGYVSLRVMEILRTVRQVEAMLRIALPDLTEDDLRQFREVYQKQFGRYHPDMATGTMPSLVASLVASRFDMHGPAYTLDAACASGILAIEHSISLLRSGTCDIAVAGGMHTGQSAMFWGPFDLIGALSHRGEIAPFSKEADGLLIGQGGGFIVLKTLSKALEDGDRIYALIKDTAVTSDGSGSHPLVTSVPGELRVLKQAWERAGMDPRHIGYVEAHGTGTPAGDRVEVTTLKEFFGDNTQPPAFVGSVKSNIGHTMPAAGMMGLIKTTLALYNRKIPPTLHCEDPLPAMFESRFLPPQELIDWDGEQYPLIAGVNAFGFGGVNSHAILTAYEPTEGMPRAIRPRRQPSEGVRASAPTKEALLHKIEIRDFTDTGGDYRLALFNPTDERLQRAASIVGMDKPWRGASDIWFTNSPLLANGGKIAFLCAGYGSDEPSETDSISEMLELPTVDELLSKEDSDEESQALFRYYFISWLCKEGLTKLGVKPDLYAGNSIGEWAATVFVGMSDNSPSEIFGPAIHWPKQSYPLVAVIGADTAKALQWCSEIKDLYLTNSNCPTQVLLSGTQEAVDILVDRLKAEQVVHAVLPYGTGVHTPFMRFPKDAYDAYLATINIKEAEIPVYSAATFARVPMDKEGYGRHIKEQMTQPVYFRELIDKLYDEHDVRVFIQLGVGTLGGFIRETLVGKEFSTVAAAMPERAGAEQLRCVLAALFVEGHPIADPKFFGVKALYITEHSLSLLPKGASPIITELPELAGIVAARYGTQGPWVSFKEDEGIAGNPLLDAAKVNMREALETQDELLKLFSQLPQASASAPDASARRLSVTDGAQAVPASAALPEPFDEPVHLTFEEHPYLIDHSIVRQPADWDVQEDLFVVVPLTMTIELLADIALKYADGRKVIQMRKLNAYRWVAVEKPFDGVIRGTWKAPNVLELNLVDYAKAEFVFGEAWSEPLEEYQGVLDIGEPIPEPRSTEELYDRYAFHGPQYHSNTSIVGLFSRGIRSFARRREGRGSLLDIMGQQLGLFLHLTQKDNVISFPVRVKDLTFYSDISDQEGDFEHTMKVTKLTENSVTADMVLKRDGKIWSVARGFVCQRFAGGPDLWDVILKPQFHLLAEEIAPNIYYYANRNQGNVLSLLDRRYLNHVDNAALEGASAKRRREYITSRVALKDAVRAFARHEEGEMLYPIEVLCAHDENGKPSVYGRTERARELESFHVSLAHKDDDAVAIVAREPVGIDLEKIDEKAESFLEVAFTEQESALLAALGQPDAAIRFWVAKEACAKKAGTGLEGNPRRFEVSAVDGDILTVGEQRVKTQPVGEGYLVGWTID
jgi:acyl transferase domain-containing protein/phosphopantetheinyl transferase